MKLSAWGNYPVIESSSIKLEEIFDSSLPFIANGNLRSYGDAALYNKFVSIRSNRFLDFDEITGLLTCEAGVLLADVIETFLPRGWFLKVTPGTKLISVGGAVASDIHGKNHHIQGCFSECVESFLLLLPDSRCLKCSRTENSDFFYATCGGMGLTGIICQVSFYPTATIS